MLLNCSLDSDICSMATLTCFRPNLCLILWILLSSFDLEAWFNRRWEVGRFFASRGSISSAQRTVLIMLIVPNWALAGLDWVVHRSSFVNSHKTLHAMKNTKSQFHYFHNYPKNFYLNTYRLSSMIDSSRFASIKSLTDAKLSGF